MNDETKTPAKPVDMAAKVRLALQMKREAAEAARLTPKGPQRRSEAEAAARAAAKSKPKVRK